MQYTEYNKLNNNQKKLFSVALWLLTEKAKKEDVDISATHLQKIKRKTAYHLVRDDDKKIIGIANLKTQQAPDILFY